MADEGSDPCTMDSQAGGMALVVSILKWETFVAEATRQHGLTMAEVEEWREKFLLWAESAIRNRSHVTGRPDWLTSNHRRHTTPSPY